MGRSVVRCLTVLASLWMLSGAVRAQTWNTGILAMRGKVSARNHWLPLETLSNQQIPDEQFHIQPLDLHQMQEVVNRGTVHFVITNLAQLVQLNNRSALCWLALLRSTRGGKATSNVIGSAILVRRDSGLTSAHDLTGKTIGAISVQAFGGYLLGYKALSNASLCLERDSRLAFTGFSADALLYLLREKAVQATIVSMCLLEKMDKEDLIRKTDFMTVLSHPTSIPCLTNMPFHPDWSLAVLPVVSNELADHVTRVLFNALQNATFRQGMSASIREVEALLRDVHQHPQQRQLWLDVKGWFIQHRLVMGGAAIVLLLLTLDYIRVMLLVR